MTRRPRYPLKAPEPLRAILQRAGENRFARAREAIPAALWRDAVGPRIAERAWPISLEGGVLLLRVPSSVWANELSLLSVEICARLLERSVTVRELRFRVGTVPAVERPPERRTVRAAPSPRDLPALPDDLARVLASVNDTDLRRVIESAAAANLAWQSVTRPVKDERDSPVSEAQRAARAPRSAGGESAPPDRTSPASPAAPPSTRATGPDRSR
jgi:Dna[CI] antecedent DciA-like protein